MTDLTNFMGHMEYSSLLKLRNATNNTSDGDSFHKTKDIRNNITYAYGDFTYQHNSHGFRSPEFEDTTDLKLVVMGCSFTYGTGLPIQDTWGEILGRTIEKRYGRKVKVFNIALGGLSADSSIQHLGWLTETLGFKPDLVAFLVPSMIRYPFIETEDTFVRVTQLLPNQSYLLPRYSAIRDQAYEFYSDESRINKVAMLMNAVRIICRKNESLLIYSSWCPYTYQAIMDCSDNGSSDLLPNGFTYDIDNQYHGKHRQAAKMIYKQTIARDLAHAGPRSHYVFALEALDYLKNNNDFMELAK